MISTTYSSFGNYTCTASSNGVVVISYTAVLTGNCVLCVITIITVLFVQESLSQS